MVFTTAAKILERKESASKYDAFYNATKSATGSESLDVLFLGSSHTIDAFSPMELWKDYGITSYNLGQHSEYLPVTYWQLKNTLQYNKPKVVVLDLFVVGASTKVPYESPDDLSYVHDSLDRMPLSLTKVQAVFDLIPEDASKAEFLCDFIMYHNRFNALTENDFAIVSTTNMGAESRVGVTYMDPLHLIDESNIYIPETTGMDYLDKIVNLCKENDIEVVFTYLPFSADATAQSCGNGMQQVADSYHVNYINFLKEDVVDYRTDFADTSHVNPSGMRKVTGFIGNYLSTNYTLSDRRTDSNYVSWYNDYNAYLTEKLNTLINTSDTYPYLMLLNDESLNYTLEISGASNFLSNSQVQALIENLGGTGSGNWNTILENGENYLLVKDGSDTTEYIGKESVALSTSFGDFTYTCDNTNPYMHIIVYDSTGTQIDDITYYDNNYGYLRAGSDS